MKAAILRSFREPLEIQEMPNPILGTGEVIVDVVAAPVLPYMKEVLSGERQYLLDLPQVPGAGAIGRVKSVGPDATRLSVGDWVLCDPTVRSRDGALTPDITLQGLSARGEGGLKLQKHFRHGSFAEQLMVPTENAIPLGSIDENEAAKWCTINTFLVPYGGLVAANLQPGETLLVSGATGHFGSACVALALVMGAGCVIATGRNEVALEDLSRRFGPRVRTVTLSGNEEDDCANMKRAASGSIDCVFDILPPTASAKTVRSAIMSVRPYGRVVLMGGVGMLGGTDLEIPYPWIMRNCITIHGQWLCPSHVIPRCISLIRSGILPLNLFDVSAFSLGEANHAVEHAAENTGPFKMTVIQP